MMEIVIGFLKDFGISFWQLTMEMAPWLLLGFLFAGILKAGILFIAGGTTVALSTKPRFSQCSLRRLTS